MGIFSSLFGKPKPKTPDRPTPPRPPRVIKRKGQWIQVGGRHYYAARHPEIQMEKNHPLDFDIVGESHYQENLKWLVGESAPAGDKYVEKATLILEDDNPYDEDAVRVDIEGLTVGYLSRVDAIAFRAKECERQCHAAIVGGFEMDDGSRASYGVKLDLDPNLSTFSPELENSAAQISVWREAIKKGILAPDAKKFWVSTPDDDCCQACRELDTKRVGIEEDFGPDIFCPPLHDGCRCAMGLEDE